MRSAINNIDSTAQHSTAQHLIILPQNYQKITRKVQYSNSKAQSASLVANMLANQRLEGHH